MITPSRPEINATRRATTITSPQPGPTSAHRPTPTIPRVADHLNVYADRAQWWLEVRVSEMGEVAAHLVNLAWNWLSYLEHSRSCATCADRTSAPIGLFTNT